MPPPGTITSLVTLRRIFGPPFQTLLDLPLAPGGPLMALTIIIISVMVWDLGDRERDFAVNNEMLSLDFKCRREAYDYIVVGGGTAGMIVATRLANASRDISVLLLEAGGEPSFYNNIPSLDFYMMNQPPNTWAYNSVPQTNSSQNFVGKRSFTTRGKMLGGSSSTNFMVYSRGNPKDFDRWAEDVNDTQWNYKNLLPYFKKSENYNGAYSEEDSTDEYHGRDGLLHVTSPDFMPGVEDFLAAGKEKGYRVGDYNGDYDGEVFSKIDMTIKDGFRESSYRAFYKETGKPRNLCIKKFAAAVKINFRGTKTTGVTYKRHGITTKVNALQEVILSAGVFGSAKLLLSSGVGPESQLRKNWIPLIKDLPVGHNLQDHLFVAAGPFLKGPSFNLERTINMREAIKFLTSGKGPLANAAAISGHAFLQSPFADPPYPDLQIVNVPLTLCPSLPQIFNRISGIRKDVLDAWLGPLYKERVDATLVFIILGRPRSIGEMTLGGDDSNHNIKLNPRYLSQEVDLETLVHGFKIVVDLFENTTAMNHTPLLSIPVPGCEEVQFKSDDYYRCVVRRMSGSLSHHLGTCAMGKVVDSFLKVYGIEGLRIADVSVIPRMLNSNPMAAAIMIGEKAADLIIRDMNKI